MKRKIFVVASVLIIFLTLLLLVKIPTKEKSVNIKDKRCGIWLSYYEADFNMENEKEFAKSVDKLYNKLEKNNIDTLYLHVRANCDAIYNSKIFTYSEYYLKNDGTSPNFDPLKILASKAREYNISLHAWINPYRVSNTKSKIYDLPDNHAAKILFEEDNDAVIEWKNGIYLNPGSQKAIRLITDGIKELLEYDIDGIHFDDYFYPTTSEEFDESTYQEYLDSGGKLSLDDWRRANVDTLISSVYRITKSNGKIFGISPMADIYTNYNEKYADVEKWVLEDGYIDYIAPQIYYGFNNPYKPFKATLDDWLQLAKAGEKELFVGLASYKQGNIDKYIAENYPKESKEWIENKNLLFEEAKYATEKECVKGIIIFSYKNYFDNKYSKNRESISKLFKNG